MAKNVALLLAAGSGSRMQESTADKILTPIAGVPVVCYSVRAFINSGVCNQITIVYKDSQQRENIETFNDEQMFLEVSWVPWPM